MIKKARDVIRILEAHGWGEKKNARGKRGGGSHRKYVKSGYPYFLIVPTHNLGAEIDPNILDDIIKRSGIPEEEWR